MESANVIADVVRDARLRLDIEVLCRGTGYAKPDSLLGYACLGLISLLIVLKTGPDLRYVDSFLASTELLSDATLEDVRRGGGVMPSQTRYLYVCELAELPEQTEIRFGGSLEACQPNATLEPFNIVRPPAFLYVLSQRRFGLDRHTRYLKPPLHVREDITYPPTAFQSLTPADKQTKGILLFFDDQTSSIYDEKCADFSLQQQR